MDLNNKMIIVDDHVLYRKGIKYFLEKERIVEVVQEADNGMELLDLLEHQIPDLVLISFELSSMDSLELTQNAIARFPGLRIMVFNLQQHETFFSNLIKAGAMGVLLKGSGIPEFEKAIKTVLAGESYFPDAIIRSFIFNSVRQPSIQDNSTGLVGRISNRELEILRYFCDGLTINEIADKLCRSIKTIEVHRTNLLQKTATKNTVNLVLYAIKNRLVLF
jgi:DNA-binding NarL/FixJ family response regulator